MNWLDALVQQVESMSRESNDWMSKPAEIGMGALLGTLNMGAGMGTRMLGKPLSSAPQITQDQLPFQEGPFGILNPDHPMYGSPLGMMMGPVLPYYMEQALGPQEPALAALAQSYMEARGVPQKDSGRSPRDDRGFPDNLPLDRHWSTPNHSPLNDPRFIQMVAEAVEARQSETQFRRAESGTMGPHSSDAYRQWEPGFYDDSVTEQATEPSPEPGPGEPGVVADDVPVRDQILRDFPDASEAALGMMEQGSPAPPEYQDFSYTEGTSLTDDTLKSAAVFLLSPGGIFEGEHSEIEGFASAYRNMSPQDREVVSATAISQLESFLKGGIAGSEDLSLEEITDLVVEPLMRVAGYEDEAIQATNADLELLAQQWGELGTDEITLQQYIARRMGGGE